MQGSERQEGQEEEELGNNEDVMGSFAEEGTERDEGVGYRPYMCKLEYDKQLDQPKGVQVTEKFLTCNRS